jgi:Protein of unknown function (DUF3606)
MMKSSIHHHREKTMTISSTQATHAGQYDQPININEPASVNYWLNTLQCSELELRVAVADVGPMASDVGNQLGRAA